MLKIFLPGLWVSIVTILSFYVLFLRPSYTNTETYTQISEDKSAYVIKGDLVTIPIIVDDVISYFFVKLSFIVDRSNKPESYNYFTDIATDYIYTLLSGSQMSDFTKIKSFGVDNLRQTIKNDLNLKLGTKFLLDVLVTQFNYVSLNDIHTHCVNDGYKIPDLINDSRSVRQKYDNN